MLSAFFESLPGNPDWRAELAAAQDIDDISNVFRHVFSETMPPSNSPFFKDTFNSVTISIDQLVPSEAADPERVKRAHESMAAAKSGTGEKRAPIRVIDMGNGKFKVLDGNTTLQALKDLGETDVVVEIKKSLKQQGVKTIEDVYAAAEIALPAFKEWVEAFGAKTGAKVILRPGLKGKERAAEKIENDYEGDESKLLDVVAATLVFDTTSQVAMASSLISKDPAVFWIKNGFENPTKEGYPGIIMKVMIGGHICELQMNTAPIIDAKENGLGHEIYNVIRQLKPIASQEELGEVSILADGFISRLNKVSTKVYRAAASRMSSSNSSASAIADDSETEKAFEVILKALSESSISFHFAIDLPHMRNTLPPDRSMAYGTNSFSINSKLRDSISNPPFDVENITRNGGKVNAKVITGKRDRAYLSDNDMLVLQYAVVEAKNLVASHNADFTPNPEFPAELQPRDRTRDTMKGQIPTISNTLNPDRLGDSLYASVGSPIVGRDLAVESGNGRTMAIRQRYNKDGATEYKAWIIQNAGKFGFNPEKLAEIQQPVLVRIRLSGGDRRSITERANEADIASMSPMEQAKVDDSRLTAADMERFTPSKDGDIAAASNAGFIAKFIEKVGKAEAAGLLTADSRPTKALVDRIQCAIFSKAYADDRLLTLMAEETHPAVKNILTALTAAAPVFAKIRASYPDMGGINLVDNIIEATRLMVQARDDGDGIEMILSQMGLFSQIPEETKDITRILNDNIRRSKHLGTVFKLAGERILTFLQYQNQVGLFGKEPAPTASEVIKGAIARAAELDPANKQKGIFEDGDEGEYDEDDDDDLVMESAPSVANKQPWQMSRDTYISISRKRTAKNTLREKQWAALKRLLSQNTEKKYREGLVTTKQWKTFTDRCGDPDVVSEDMFRFFEDAGHNGMIVKESPMTEHTQHYYAVLDAISKGLPVAKHVLEDYPEFNKMANNDQAPDASGTSAPSVADKQPWDMTREEFNKSEIDKMVASGIPLDIAEEQVESKMTVYDGDTASPSNYHERSVTRSLLNGDLSVADYTRLHEKDYGPMGKFAGGAPPGQWRFDIREAKTFQDIANVFKREFGVTLDDDPVLDKKSTMFETSLEKMEATIFIENGLWDILSSDNVGLGSCGLIAGFNKISSHKAIAIIDSFDKALRSCPKKYKKRIRSERNSIVSAFGPDMMGIRPFINDLVMEAAQVRTPATVEENIQRGTEAMNRVISKHGNEPKAMYRQDLGWIAFYWGKPGRKPPSFSSEDDMLEWWNSLKDKFSLFEGGHGVSHIIAKRDWEGKYIRGLLGQKGVSVASKLVEVIAKGHHQPSPKDKATIVIDGYAATLALTRFQNDQVWLLSGFKEVAKEDYNLIYESSGVYSFSNMAKNYAYNDYSGHQNMGAEDDQNLYHPNYDVNKIFESASDTIAQDVTATKQPWEMTKDEYNEDYQDSPLQQSLIDKWANDSKTIKHKDFESFRASWWVKNDPHTQAVEQAMSDGLTVPDAVLNDFRNSPKIKWRIGIRKAKTFQDIADVFSDVFGVTLDDDAELIIP